ncbi:(R)-mandelonitrile lyase [Spirillospora sp. CA-128828]|uniref:(R)-mandelonitrile lyase n=1 Tax=Spirillospora sp. CA-128828 TaxID=3240033 RepID=UPI003D920E87
MEILKRRPTGRVPAEWFTGEAWLDVIYAGEEPSRARLNRVRFAPGARTDWHSHVLGQTLHIVSGVALVQERGGQLIEAHPGDTIYTPPGQEHWHGAAPDAFMEHLALWEGSGDPDAPDTIWGEKVTDTEYKRPRSTTRG